MRHGKVTEVKRTGNEKEANEHLSSGWDLFAVAEKPQGIGVSYVLVRYEEDN